MSAPLGNKNSVGNSGGKTVNDRILAAEVRQLALNKIKGILEGRDSDYQRQILLRLAGTILPRLNEITGEHGKALFVKQITGMQIIKQP